MQGNSKAVANCERPKYASCEFGKGHCRPNKVNTIKKSPMKEQDLKKDNLLPGQMVCADHYIQRAPGRIYHTKGKSDQSYMFSGGCVFIDHASGYKPGWQKAKPVERVYVKYDPKNNLPTHEANLPNQREKEAQELTNAVCVTNESNQNLTP